jgi:hypothetical protein
MNVLKDAKLIGFWALIGGLWTFISAHGAFRTISVAFAGLLSFSDENLEPKRVAIGIVQLSVLGSECFGWCVDIGLSGFLMVWCLPVPALSLTSSWSLASTGQPFNTLDLTNGPSIGNAVWTLQTFLTQ